MNDAAAATSPATLAPVPPLQELSLAAPPVEIAPERRAANGRFAVRVWCTFVFTLCAGMMGVGLWLSPSGTGVGTHEQMGLPPCAFLATTGYPCPTCGCTTAVSHFAHGQFVASFVAQPFGFTVGLLATMLIPLTLAGMCSGRWIGPSMFTIGWYWRTWAWGGTAILLLAWLYKAIMMRAGW